MLGKGRLIGIFFAVFALVCLAVTYDYSRGRTTSTSSPLVSDVLAATTARDCGRDATEIVQRYIPVGTDQAQAEQVLQTVAIEPPKPWFWKPSVENSTSRDGDSLDALRTIKITAFGNNLLRIHLSFAERKVKRVAAEVVCRFE
jgi:hypothetical protein